MEKSKVYFTSFHTKHGENIPSKFRKLILAAGLDQIDFQDKFVAIKIHFGEMGNLAFLRPNYAKVVVDLVKERGGKPFLTDCNTLYVGSRKNALDHMDTAYTNGFSPFSTGCHVIIADGLKGTDDIKVPVEGTYIHEAKIGRAIMDADILISLTHFKGHEGTGFGGTLKNIGMGSGSRDGKKEMHSAGKPHVLPEQCVGCGLCTGICAHDAAIVTDGKANIYHDRCVGCGRCIGVCPRKAIASSSDAANDVLNCKIAEYTKAACQNRPTFHISVVQDVSPNCDCHSENDIPIIPDVGMFASFDPIALDMACADSCNKQPVNAGSMVEKNLEKINREQPELLEKEAARRKVYNRNNSFEGIMEPDHFFVAHPQTNWMKSIEHGEKIGLGTREYELITLP